MDKNYKPRGTFDKKFLSELKIYNWIVDYAHSHQSGLDIKVRGNYLNVYYNGGNLMKLEGKDKIFFSEYYFYLPQKGGLASSDIQRLIKSNDNIDKSGFLRNKKRQELAKLRKNACEIHERLKSERDALVNQLKYSNTFDEVVSYIEKMKRQMDKWKGRKGNAKNERSIQQYISLYNQSFDEGTDYIVLDVEYALPYNAVYFNKESYGSSCHPRLDIIAVDKSGQIYVMELKYGLKSVGGKSSISDHLKDFNNTVGHPDKWKAFVEDVKVLFDYQKGHGLIDHEAVIDITKKPVFMLVLKEEKNGDRENFIKEMRFHNIPDNVQAIFLPKDNSKVDYPECNYKLKKV